jgi:hypothetical protein
VSENTGVAPKKGYVKSEIIAIPGQHETVCTIRVIYMDSQSPKTETIRTNTQSQVSFKHLPIISPAIVVGMPFQSVRSYMYASESDKCTDL